MSPRPPRMHGKKGFTHSRIWWLLHDNGNCQSAGVFREIKASQKVTYDRMLAILDHTDRKGPPQLPSQYKPVARDWLSSK